MTILFDDEPETVQGISKTEIEAINASKDIFISMAEKMEVKTIKDKESAIAKLSEIKKEIKKHDDWLKQTTAGAKKFIDDAKAIVKPTLDALAQADRIIRDKINEQQRIEMEQAEAKRKADQIEYESKLENASPDQVVIPPRNDAPTKKLGDASFRTVKKWRVVDETKIPKKYWVLDEVAIGKVIRSGGDIDGIESYDDQQISVK